MRRLLFMLALTGAVGSFAPVSAHADPVAIIASLKGKVTVQAVRSSEPATATFGRALEAGDRVQLAAGAAATILFNDGNVVELGEKSSITIGGGAKGGKSGGKLPSDVFAQVSKLTTGGSRRSGLVVMAPMRSGGAVAGPEPVSPRLDAGYRPAFALRARVLARAARTRAAALDLERYLRDAQDLDPDELQETLRELELAGLHVTRDANGAFTGVEVKTPR